MEGGGEQGEVDGGGDGEVEGGGEGNTEGGGNGAADGGRDWTGASYTFSSVGRSSRLLPTCITVIYSPPVLSDQPELDSPHHITYG